MYGNLPRADAERAWDPFEAQTELALLLASLDAPLKWAASSMFRATTADACPRNRGGSSFRTFSSSVSEGRAGAMASASLRRYLPCTNTRIESP